MDPAALCPPSWVSRVADPSARADQRPAAASNEGAEGQISLQDKREIRLALTMSTGRWPTSSNEPDLVT